MKKITSPAFTLVEVVLALGVVSFAVVTLLALIPTGMSVFQQAQTNNVETQIVQQINTELQNAPFSSLFSATGVGTNTTVFGASGTRSYDMEGNYLTGPATSPNPPVYIVTLTSYPFTNVTGNGPINLTTSPGQVLAQTVQFNVAFHNRTNTYSTLIVNKGY